jgi:hypothetical protein
MKANFPDDVFGHFECPAASGLHLTPTTLLVH